MQAPARSFSRSQVYTTMSSESNFALELLKPMLATAFANNFNNNQTQQPAQQVAPAPVQQHQFYRGNRGGQYGHDKARGPSLYDQVQEQRTMLQEVLQHFKAQQQAQPVQQMMTNSPVSAQQSVFPVTQPTSASVQVLGGQQQIPQHSAHVTHNELQQYFNQLSAQLEQSVTVQIKQLADELAKKQAQQDAQLNRYTSRCNSELQRLNDAVSKVEHDVSAQVEAQMFWGEKVRVLRGKIEEPSYVTNLIKRDIRSLQAAMTEVTQGQLTGAASKRAKAVQSYYDDDDGFVADMAEAAAEEAVDVEEAEPPTNMPQRPARGTPGTQGRRGSARAGTSTDPVDVSSAGPKKPSAKAAGKAKVPPAGKATVPPVRVAEVISTVGGDAEDSDE